ncbi:hypothetical protein [Nocardia fusca]|uniref:hypothetical protein n=1 Tax=Nocardia fusca TaxID=941183 RepID=UPI0007A75104|nr:hypothetical protein [Nocardia fusca]
MPRDSRALTRAARRRADAHEDLPYQKAREQVIVIRQLATEEEITFEQAQAIYDDPLNQLLCETCQWTVGMICPECPGCGCYNGRCSGWRHREYMHDDERDDLYACDECGGDTRTGYDCQC